MKFGQLRHRIVLMKKRGYIRNSMSEEVPIFEIYHPGLNLIIVYEDRDEQGGVCWRIKSDENHEFSEGTDKVYADTLEQSKYAFRAEVKPTTGREYEEMQKIRAETTYNVYMRFLPGITHDMFILHNDKKLNIESILDIGERHKELTIVCSEVQR